MYKITQYVHILWLILLSFSANSQSTNNLDFQNWNAFQINYKLNKRIKIQFNNEIRISGKYLTFQKSISEIETKYSFTKKSSLSVGLRYFMVNDVIGKIKEIENHFRYNFDYVFEQKIYNFSFNFRWRYQQAKEINKTIYDGSYPNNVLRNRLKMKYKIPHTKFTPYFSYEAFYRRQIGALNGIDKFRLTIGTAYKFNKKWKMAVGYLRQSEYRIWNPEKINSIDVSISYNLK